MNGYREKERIIQKCTAFQSKGKELLSASRLACGAMSGSPCLGYGVWKVMYKTLLPPPVTLPDNKGTYDWWMSKEKWVKTFLSCGVLSHIQGDHL